MTTSNEIITASEFIAKATEVIDRCKSASDEEFSRLVEAYHRLLGVLKAKAYQDQAPDRSIDWLEQSYVPQSMQFVIDVLPVIQELLNKNFRREDLVSFLDVGPGSGSGANLIATLHRSTLLGPALKVDAIDVLSFRKRYAALVFPDINLEIGDIKNIPEGRRWDIVYCSHTIEHVPDPVLFLKHLVRISKRYVIVYAPYNEKELIKGHRNRITEALFESYHPILVRKFGSFGWHRPRGDLCLLVVLDLAAHPSQS